VAWKTGACSAVDASPANDDSGGITGAVDSLGGPTASVEDKGMFAVVSVLAVTVAGLGLLDTGVITDRFLPKEDSDVEVQDAVEFGLGRSRPGDAFLR